MNNQAAPLSAKRIIVHYSLIIIHYSKLGLFVFLRVFNVKINLWAKR